MKLKLLIIAMIPLVACNESTQAIQISENTFAYGERIYRIIDNQITELGDLKKDSIARSKVLTSQFRGYGTYDLDYIKKGASCMLDGVYRGDLLYFKLKIEGLNDLREKYSGGQLTINFLDDFGFIIHDTKIYNNELIRIVGTRDETLYFEYHGKTQMSSELYEAISNYSVSSSLLKRGSYGW